MLPKRYPTTTPKTVPFALSKKRTDIETAIPKRKHIKRLTFVNNERML
jgi:hypothetical protein